MDAPSPEYLSRLAIERRRHNDAARVDERVAWLRLATFGGGVLVAYLAWSDRLSWWWLALPALLFVALIRWHDAVIGRRDRALKVAAYYERGLARLEDRWMNLASQTSDRRAEPDHLYAADLDLFGPGSLFQLLSLARTRSGEERLAAWMLAPASPAVIVERQEAIAELAVALDLREDLWSAGADFPTAAHPETLVQWAEAPPALPSWLQLVAAALTVAVAGTAVMAANGFGTLWLIVIFALEGLVLYRFFEPVGRVLHQAGSWSRDLDVLAGVLTHIERQRFTSTLLERVVAKVRAEAAPPSVSIKRLHRLSEMHDWQHNVLFAAVAIPLLWGVHLALAMERWRRHHGSQVRSWLDAVGEFEALSSLAAYRYEHPQDVFPDIDDTGKAMYLGAGLGHPLLPEAKMVRNDVRLDADRQLLVISGSNMSGKSTLLRTVGVNAVMGLMGSPVRATSLRLSPLAVGATLRIQDSLQQGRSRFFAEITRVKEITDRTRQALPVLFLLDELFHGTNSHDRLAGASGVLGALLRRGAIGLITTHDMALVAVADQLAPRAANVHFDDRYEEGEMRFDYRMKPGPVTSSNALALMRAVGLDVDGA